MSEELEIQDRAAREAAAKAAEYEHGWSADIDTEFAPSQYVGTAVTLQTCLGFLLTIVTIRLVPVWVRWWGWLWGGRCRPALVWCSVVGLGVCVGCCRQR